MTNMFTYFYHFLYWNIDQFSDKVLLLRVCPCRGQSGDSVTSVRVDERQSDRGVPTALFMDTPSRGLKGRLNKHHSSRKKTSTPVCSGNRGCLRCAV